MAHGFLFAVHIEAVREIIKANAVERFGKPAETRHAILLLEGHQDEFHAIAGGDDDRFFDLRLALKPAQGFRDDPLIQRKTLAQLKGRFFVTDSHDNQIHESISLTNGYQGANKG